MGTLRVSGIQLATVLTSMTAEYYLINDGGNRQAVETVSKSLPQPEVIFASTWDGSQETINILLHTMIGNVDLHS